MTVVVVGNNEKQNGNLSDSVPNNTEVDGDWMLGTYYKYTYILYFVISVLS